MGTQRLDREDMGPEEDGLQVTDLAAQVEGISFADSGNKEGEAGFEPVGLALSTYRVRCHIIGSFIFVLKVLLLCSLS